jgi:alpha-L-arabinofuranosidase
LALGKASPVLSSALQNSVSVKGKAGTVIGISNPGYWGIEVKPQTYTGSFYVLGAYKGKFTAQLKSSSGAILASAVIASKSVSKSWTQHNFNLTPTAAAPNVNNTFQLTFTPTNSSTPLNFNLISLFPPTYNNRSNGLRIDLMNALKGLNPSFLRLPGGNNLEGGGWGNWWNWTATIGSLTERPGRTGTWNYYNTDGLGLIEYMFWCKDLNMEPILAIWSGLYLNGVVLSEAALEPYVTDALNELEFLMGDASTKWGAKRIALGYQDPFQINYVEVSIPNTSLRELTD